MCPHAQVFGRRLATFWAVIVAAVFILFQVYVISYHSEVLAEQSDSDNSTDSSSSSKRRLMQVSSASNSSDAADALQCDDISGHIPMIVLMCILVAYVLFQTLITLMNGVSFASHPADKAVHHPGSRVARLELLQQTSPYWDFIMRMNQTKEKYSHQPAVVDGLNVIMLPYVTQPYGNSAMDVAADATQQNIITGALPAFVDLLNVSPPFLIIYLFLSF